MTLRYIYSFFVFAFLIAAGIAGFNFAVDPQCIFRCGAVDKNRPTTNGFYRMAQIVERHRDIEQIIVGSSRGEGMPFSQIEKVTGLKTANLSTGGADLMARLAYINFAVERLNLRRIIWQADYFELLTDNASAQIRLNPALMRYVPERLYPSGMKTNLQRVARLLDKDTTEASIRILSDGTIDKEYMGEELTDTREECLSPTFAGKTSAEELPKQIHLLYENYTRQVFKVEENPYAFAEFEKAIRSYADKGIEVVFLIPPYNPIFSQKLQTEFPEIWKKHLHWVNRIENLEGISVKVKNFLAGFPGDDASERFWEDGVHFTCRGFQLMIGNSLK